MQPLREGKYQRRHGARRQDVRDGERVEGPRYIRIAPEDRDEHEDHDAVNQRERQRQDHLHGARLRRQANAGRTREQEDRHVGEGVEPDRRDADEVANPLVDAPIKSNTLLRIDRADPATGNVRLIRTRGFDADAMKEFLSRLAQQVGGGDGKDSQQFDNFRKQFTMVIDSRTEIDVEEGMTRAVRTDDTATISAPGRSTVKRTHKQITVTRAP